MLDNSDQCHIFFFLCSQCYYGFNIKAKDNAGALLRMEKDLLVLQDTQQSVALQETFNENYTEWHKDAKNRNMETFAAVLEDQKQALDIARSGGNPRTMRWHSLTIKFALKQAEDNTKAGYDRLRDAFFLPAARTLRGMQATMKSGGGYQRTVFEGAGTSALTTRLPMGRMLRPSARLPTRLPMGRMLRPPARLWTRPMGSYSGMTEKIFIDMQTVDIVYGLLIPFHRAASILHQQCE